MRDSKGSKLLPFPLISTTSFQWAQEGVMNTNARNRLVANPKGAELQIYGKVAGFRGIYRNLFNEGPPEDILKWPLHGSCFTQTHSSLHEIVTAVPFVTILI